MAKNHQSFSFSLPSVLLEMGVSLDGRVNACIRIPADQDLDFTAEEARAFGQHFIRLADRMDEFENTGLWPEK